MCDCYVKVPRPPDTAGAWQAWASGAAESGWLTLAAGPMCGAGAWEPSQSPHPAGAPSLPLESGFPAQGHSGGWAGLILFRVYRVTKAPSELP